MDESILPYEDDAELRVQKLLKEQCFVYSNKTECLQQANKVLLPIFKRRIELEHITCIDGNFGVWVPEVSFNFMFKDTNSSMYYQKAHREYQLFFPNDEEWYCTFVADYDLESLLKEWYKFGNGCGLKKMYDRSFDFENLLDHCKYVWVMEDGDWQVEVLKKFLRTVINDMYYSEYNLPGSSQTRVADEATSSQAMSAEGSVPRDMGSQVLSATPPTVAYGSCGINNADASVLSSFGNETSLNIHGGYAGANFSISDSSICESENEDEPPQKKQRTSYENDDMDNCYLALSNIMTNYHERFVNLSENMKQRCCYLMEMINKYSDEYLPGRPIESPSVYLDEHVDYPETRSEADIRYITRCVFGWPLSRKIPSHTTAQGLGNFLVDRACLRDFDSSEYLHCMINKKARLGDYGMFIAESITKITFETMVSKKRSNTFYFVDKNAVSMLKEFVLYTAKRPVEDTSAFLYLLNYFKRDSEGDNFVLDISCKDFTMYMVFDVAFSKMIILGNWPEVTNTVKRQIIEIVDIIGCNFSKLSELEIAFFPYKGPDSLVGCINVMTKYNVNRVYYNKLRSLLKKINDLNVKEQMFKPNLMMNKLYLDGLEDMNRYYAFKCYQ